jgi:predicted permease
VIGEIALTVMLLSGAALFGRSVVRLLSIDTGFRVERLMTTNVVLPQIKYSSDQPGLVAAYMRLEQRLHEIPGVEGVGMTSKLPLDFGNSSSFAIVGKPAPDPGNRPSASYRQVSTDYFRTLGIPVVSGRAFAAGDDANAPNTRVIVNRALAKAYFDGRDPVGQQLISGNDTATIVGLVGDVPIGKLEDRIPPTLYYSFARLPSVAMSIAIRTSADAGQIDRSVRQALAQADPGGAITPVRAMEDLITDSPSVFMRRFPLFLVGAFAAAALALAIVGIYGVVSYSVAQRTREMGIRMALGAQPGSLVSLVMRHGGRMAAAGIVLGVVGAVLSGRYAATLLYGVTATDPLTYLAVAVVLSIVAVAATVLPARRATRVDPALALRSE